MTLPNPQDYQDGVQFFRDTHKIVLHCCAELERLLADAEQQGVFQSFAANPEWQELFDFFTLAAPQHERDEENILFPVLIQKLPRVGFQQPAAPIRFLIEGHEVLQTKTSQLVQDWDAYRNLHPDPTLLTASHAHHTAEDAAFIAIGRELATLYREHVRLEEERVYSVADKLLSRADKFALMEALQQEHTEETTMTLLEFDRPQFSDPGLRTEQSNTDAQSNRMIDAEYEDDNEEESLEI